MCGGCIEKAARDCVLGSCNHCGLRQLWRNNLRNELLHDDGQLKPGIADKHQVGANKNGKLTGTGEPGIPIEKQEEVIRQQLEGTIIELLDEFETKVMSKYPFHRQTRIKQKAADKQREDNLPPGVLDAYSDHSF